MSDISFSFQAELTWDRPARGMVQVRYAKQAAGWAARRGRQGSLTPTTHQPWTLQPHGVLVLADNGLLVAAEQHTAQGDRQDQAVESTGQDDHALRAAEDRHNKRGESDETDDEPLVVLGDEGVNGLEEGDGGVGRADDGGDTGGEQRETEETVADVVNGKGGKASVAGLAAPVTAATFQPQRFVPAVQTPSTHRNSRIRTLLETQMPVRTACSADFLLAAPPRIEQLVRRKVMYPPQEPPSSVTMTGMSSLGFSGVRPAMTASPTGAWP